MSGVGEHARRAAEDVARWVFSDLHRVDGRVGILEDKIRPYLDSAVAEAREADVEAIKEAEEIWKRYYEGSDPDDLPSDSCLDALGPMLRARLEADHG